MNKQLKMYLSILKYLSSHTTTTSQHITNINVNAIIFGDESDFFYPQVNSNTSNNLNNSLDPNKII